MPKGHTKSTILEWILFEESIENMKVINQLTHLSQVGFPIINSWFCPFLLKGCRVIIFLFI